MDDTSTQVATFGNLYNFYAVETGELCPSGWHVATKEDFEELISNLGGNSIAGGKLKSTDFSH